MRLCLEALFGGCLEARLGDSVRRLCLALQGPAGRRTSALRGCFNPSRSIIISFTFNPQRNQTTASVHAIICYYLLLMWAITHKFTNEGQQCDSDSRLNENMARFTFRLGAARSTQWCFFFFGVIQSCLEDISPECSQGERPLLWREIPSLDGSFCDRQVRPISSFLYRQLQTNQQLSLSQAPPLLGEQEGL
ncbi:unnamed protein product [Boreogadus saida]